jgi:hypothetical protein
MRSFWWRQNSTESPTHVFFSMEVAYFPTKTVIPANAVHITHAVVQKKPVVLFSKFDGQPAVSRIAPKIFES